MPSAELHKLFQAAERRTRAGRDGEQVLQPEMLLEREGQNEIARCRMIAHGASLAAMLFLAAIVCGWL